MKIHVYDTHVTTEQGQYLHFDVLVNDQNLDKVQEYAQAYLDSKGIQTAQIKQGKCQFCHTETASDVVQQQIQNRGYSIIEL